MCSPSLIDFKIANCRFQIKLCFLNQPSKNNKLLNLLSAENFNFTPFYHTKNRKGKPDKVSFFCDILFKNLLSWFKNEFFNQIVQKVIEQDI